MIIGIPLHTKSEDWIKLVKSMAMKMVKTTIKIHNSPECSNESF